MQQLCLWALALYPHAWRVRYEAELQALIEVRPLSLRTVLDLLRGAFDAHLHPGGIVATPRQRMRGTIAATLSCWIALVLLGAGFAKSTEDLHFANNAHAPLDDTRIGIALLAIACALVVAAAGAPLACGVLRQAFRERTRTLVRAIWAAVAAVAGFLALTGVVSLLGRGNRGPTLLGHWLFVGYVGLVVLVAIACALAARAGLMSARFGAGQLVLGVAGAWLLARLMAALTVAVALYTVLLALEVPNAAASPNGPFSVNTTIVLASQVVGMALCSSLAAVTTRRGRRALLGG